MSYSVDIERAAELSRKVHDGAVDKAGEAYWKHPYRVAEWLHKPEEKVVGYLHDTVEDTEITLDDIRTMFGEDTARAVEAVTHRKDEPWADYLARAKAEPVARQVKIADLIDNSNMTRLKEVTPRDVKRTAKYIRALYFMMDVDGI